MSISLLATVPFRVRDKTRPGWPRERSRHVVLARPLADGFAVRDRQSELILLAHEDFLFFLGHGARLEIVNIGGNCRGIARGVRPTTFFECRRRAVQTAYHGSRTICGAFLPVKMASFAWH